MPTIQFDARLTAVAAGQPFPLVFATVSGAHLYGFPSPDSDCDLRGVHVLPARTVVGLDPGPETIAISEKDGGSSWTWSRTTPRSSSVCCSVGTATSWSSCYSPLVVVTTPEHAELKAIARGCVTRHHSHHYLGFAADAVEAASRRRVPGASSRCSTSIGSC